MKRSESLFSGGFKKPKQFQIMSQVDLSKKYWQERPSICFIFRNNSRKIDNDTDDLASSDGF